MTATPERSFSKLKLIITYQGNNYMGDKANVTPLVLIVESLIDVTLACDGRLFQAHKFVLSMCSEYFKEMFNSNPCKHPIVYLKDVHAEDMEALLDFMYCGVVHIPQENLSGLLKTAEGLQIRGLGLFAKEAGDSIANAGIGDRSNMMEPSVLMSPERKRSLDFDHTEAFNFSDGENADINMHPSPQKKAKNLGPPAPIPDLPRVSDDMLDLGGGYTIPSQDYFKFRRIKASSYINDLLRYFFPIDVLASSSLTGTECFANKGKNLLPSNKNQLDPAVIRIITLDAIRNFPALDEKQVRNCIRRKLNTESRIYRSQEKIGSVPGANRNGTQRRRLFKELPRALVSIEKSDRDKQKGLGMIPPNLAMDQGPKEQQQPRPSYPSPGQIISGEKTGDTKREGESTSYMGHHDGQSVKNRDTMKDTKTTTPTPVATPSLPSSSSSPANLVKAELPSTVQYLPQEYSYPSVMAPHVTQTTYLPHHMAAVSEPAYMRRLEMSQGGSHPTPLTYSYPHASLPTTESMESSLHM
ncbi:unnamed protein product, partial [Meganyctiphanes norvegica]